MSTLSSSVWRRRRPMREHCRRGLVSIVIATLATTLIALPAWGQATSAGIQGKVTDPAGSPVAGASVVVTNTQTGLTRVLETDTAGDFLAQGLPPAPYLVEVTATGFFSPPFEQTLNLGRVAQLNIQLSLQETDTVIVTADRPVLNTTESEVSTVVDQVQIQELPLLNRDFTDLASLAPGAKPKQTGQVDPTKNESLYRPFTIGAGNGRAVNIQIDGGDANDRAVGTWTQGYTAEAIQEFEVITDQYKAEYGRAANGVVNVITRSGGNAFTGSAFGLYRDDGFREENFSERLSGAEKSPSERQQYGGSLGGYLVKDKLFFFGAYERVEQDSPTAYSPVLTGFSRTSQFAGQSFSTSLDRDLFSGKLNWNLDESHTAFVRYALDENTFSNDQGGALTPDVFNGSSTNEGWSLLGSLISTWGTLLNELTLHTTSFENGIVSGTPTDRAITPGAGSADFDFITIQGYDQISLGRNGSTPQSTIQAVDQLRNDVSLLAGDHEVKFGIDYLDVTFDESQLGALEPTIVFNFETNVTPDQVDVDSGNLALINSVAFNNPGLIPAVEYSQLGAYVQDTWRLSDRWTVYAGLRYDRDNGVFDSQKQGINRTFYEAVAAGAPGRFDNVFPEDPEHFSPRAGFVYQLSGDDVVRGSFGVFHDKVIENLTLFGTQNLSPVVFPNLPSLDCTTGGCRAGADPDGPGGVAPIPVDFTWQNWLNQGALREWYDGLVGILGPLNTLAGQSFFVPSPDWDVPVVKTASLGWGHRIDSRWSIDTNALYSEGDRQYRIWDIRGRNSGVAPSSGAGREFFFTTDGSSRYQSLQTQLRGRGEKYDVTFNVSWSKAEGSQDAGASANESGTFDIFSGGNRRYTGPDPRNNSLCNTPGGPVCVDEDSEFGLISGDQTWWANIFFSYRLPWDLNASGNVAYGTDIAFWPSAGFDANNDGFNSGSEYLGSPGSGEGDDFFSVDLRLTKTVRFGDQMKLDIFAEVFNLTDHENFGLFVDQRQANLDQTANAGFGTPTGNEVGQPRTWNMGFRFSF